MSTSERPVAVVTGAAGSIGSRLLHRLAEAGYEVVGLDLPAAVTGTPGTDLVPCDITDEKQVREVLAAVLERTGRIEVLVNNAGISAIGRFEDHDVETHRRVLEVNYLGAVACTQAALPALRRSRGTVVVTSSVAGFAPVLGRPAYVAAKHAVTGLFTALRPELAADGVRVMLVHPTFVTGGMGEAAARAEHGSRSTAGPEISADDVAVAVVAGLLEGRDQVLVGRTAWLAWHVSRLSPRLYLRQMTRRLHR